MKKDSGIGKNKRTAETVGGGAALGTIIGAIAGGAKAAIGVLVGAAKSTWPCVTTPSVVAPTNRRQTLCRIWFAPCHTRFERVKETLTTTQPYQGAI
jgi:hypothetical protein